MAEDMNNYVDVRISHSSKQTLESKKEYYTAWINSILITVEPLAFFEKIVYSKVYFKSK